MGSQWALNGPSIRNMVRILVRSFFCMASGKDCGKASGRASGVVSSLW